mmetsp:Transcript_35038/g.104503  ORF Transcript_35038/g.104503 Transcript_35038/m.104503 type:complete len:250 (+) Transcript_35038:659-1408(+)
MSTLRLSCPSHLKGQTCTTRFSSGIDCSCKQRHFSLCPNPANEQTHDCPCLPVAHTCYRVVEEDERPGATLTLFGCSLRKEASRSQTFSPSRCRCHRSGLLCSSIQSACSTCCSCQPCKWALGRIASFRVRKPPARPSSRVTFPRILLLDDFIVIPSSIFQLSDTSALHTTFHVQLLEQAHIQYERYIRLGHQSLHLLPIQIEPVQVLSVQILELLWVGHIVKLVKAQTVIRPTKVERTAGHSHQHSST